MERQWEEDPEVLATWLSVKEASRAYGVSIYQIRRWLSTGQIAAGRLPTPTGWIWRIRPRGPGDKGAPLADPPPLASAEIESALAAAEEGIARLRVLLSAYQQQATAAADQRDDPAELH